MVETDPEGVRFAEEWDQLLLDAATSIWECASLIITLIIV
jgi:hypothetical protein